MQPSSGKVAEIQPPIALIFDWDNTLIDTWALLHAALEPTFREFGLQPWSFEETRQHVRRSARETFPELFGDRAEQAIATYIQYYREISIGKLKGLEGSQAFLEKAANEGCGPLSVVSNKTGTTLRDEAAQLGWTGFFSALIGAGDAECDKPSHAPVFMALSVSGVEAGRSVWFVGDTDVDVVCAKNAGCTSVLLRETPPIAREFAECPPDLHVKNFSELHTLLAQHGFFKSQLPC